MQRIIIVLLVVVIAYVVIIFPIFVNINGKLCITNKRILYKIKLFNVLSVIKGYLSLGKSGIKIALGKKKIINYKYKKFFNIKDKVKPLKDFHILSLKSKFCVGSKNHLIDTYIFTILYVWHNEFISRIINRYKSYMNIKNEVNLYLEKDVLDYQLETVFVFNLLTVLLNVIKIIGEKWINAIFKRKK